MLLSNNDVAPRESWFKYCRLRLHQAFSIPAPPSTAPTRGDCILQALMEKASNFLWYLKL